MSATTARRVRLLEPGHVARDHRVREEVEVLGVPVVREHRGELRRLVRVGDPQLQ